MIISTTPEEEALGEPLDESAAVEWRELTVPPELHGSRLDLAAVEAAPEFSRSYLQQLIAAGAVHVDGQPLTKPAGRIRAGQRVRIELRPTPQSQAFIPEVMDLVVVYEDDHLRVIDKPAGLVVHPAPGNWRGTLLNGLLALDPRSRDLPRAGIVHRLDKDTSGLMVVARTRSAMEALVRSIAAREVSRQYLALAHGHWSGGALKEVDGAIGRDPRHRLRMAVVDLATHAGKAAATTFELLENAVDGCWLRCTLKTGRTHQIRVHLASIGHPLVGDSTYGGSPVGGLNRQALHAARLGLKHPVTQQYHVFRSHPPPDIVQALTAWGLGYNQASLE